VVSLLLTVWRANGLGFTRACGEVTLNRKPPSKRMMPPPTSRASGVGWKPLLARHYTL